MSVRSGCDGTRTPQSLTTEESELAGERFDLVVFVEPRLSLDNWLITTCLHNPQPKASSFSFALCAQRVKACIALRTEQGGWGCHVDKLRTKDAEATADPQPAGEGGARGLRSRTEPWGLSCRGLASIVPLSPSRCLLSPAVSQVRAVTNVLVNNAIVISAVKPPPSQSPLPELAVITMSHSFFFVKDFIIASWQAR